VVSQYDATQESTGSLTTVTDQQGFSNATGSVDVEASEINGKQAYHFQNESVDHSKTYTTNDPFAFVAVIKFGNTDDNTGVYDGGAGKEFYLFDNNNSDFLSSRGGTSVSSGNITKNTNPSLFTQEAFGSNQVRLIRDGQTLLNGTPGQSDLTGLTLGEGQGFFHDDVYIGQLEVLVGHTSSELQAVQNRLKSKWGTP
jgi:hypothetical protein